MPTFRGQDGSVVIGGTPDVLIGQVTTWTIVEEFGSLETSAMGNVWRTYRPGMPSWNGTMQAHFDDADVGQSALWLRLVGATPSGVLSAVEFHWENQGETLGDKHLSGDVIITGVTVTAELNNIISANFTFQGSDVLTMTPAPVVTP
jgi:hypothetical protein